MNFSPRQRVILIFIVRVPLAVLKNCAQIDYRGDHAGEISSKPAGIGVACLLHTDCAEIDRHDIKRGFGASVIVPPSD